MTLTITGTEKVQTYTICLYSNQMTAGKLMKKSKKQLPWKTAQSKIRRTQLSFWGGCVRDGWREYGEFTGLWRICPGI